VLIELRGAGKRFGRRPEVVALRPTNLTVAAGEGVRGGGSERRRGKSTLLALTLGYLRPTTGEVLLEGRPPGSGTAPAASATCRTLLPPRRWTGARRAARLAALDPRALAGRSRGPGHRPLRVGDVAARPLGELSRGTLQRVGIAQAWLTAARLLVLDEPTEGLGPALAPAPARADRGAPGAGRRGAAGQPRPAEVERLADRVVLLDRGELRASCRRVRPRPAASTT